MEFYFTDRKFNILGMASTTLPDAIPIWSDKETENVEVGVSQLEGFLPLVVGELKKISAMAAKGNFILFKNEDGEDKYFTIIRTEKDRKRSELYFYAEDAGLDLLNETVGEYEADKAYPVAHYIKKFTFDSGFELGINEASELSRQLKWEGTTNATARVLSVATQFDNCEIKYRFEIDNMKVTKKYIDIFKKRGEDLNIQLRLGHEVDNIVTIESIENLATALKPIGGTPDGEGAQPITLEGYVRDDGRFYSKGDGLLRDRESIQLWSRYLTNDAAPDKGHIVKHFEWDTLNQSTLYAHAVTELEKVSNPEINFEIDIVMLPDNVRIGDRVLIIDEEDELYLSTRILELERSRADETHKAILGDFMLKDSQVDPLLLELAEKIEKLQGMDSMSVWVRFADDDQGNGISAMPTNKEYMAVKNVLNNPVPSDDPKDYEGLWVKIIGEDGMPGSPGKDGTPTFTWIKYADNVSGGGMSNNSEGKTYIGFAYNKPTETESNIASDYEWSLFKGADGKTPIKGVDYFDGQPGQDGKSGYLHIRYSQNANGNPMTASPTNAKYIGTQASQNAVASTSYADYTWALFKGSDGVPGEPGEDGSTSYLHIKYSNDGGKTFTGNNGEDAGDYIGQYVDFTQADSNTVSAYTWSKTKGDNGLTPYTHYAWADSSDGKTNFSTTVSSGKKYMGMYTDYNPTGSTDPTKYKWVELANSIEIGGRNVLPGTEDLTGAKLGHDATIGNNSDIFGNSVATLKKQQNHTYADVLTFYTTIVPTSKEYILIFYAKGSKEDIIRCHFYDPNNTLSSEASTGQKTTKNDGQIDVTINTEWKRYWVKWTQDVPNKVKKVIIGRLYSNIWQNEEVSISSPMLISGNQIQDHVPAPEDVDQAIKNTEVKIEEIITPHTGPTPPENPKETQIWWQTDSLGDVIAHKKYTSGIWEVLPIQQSSLRIVSLDAVDITTSTITGSLMTASEFKNAGTFVEAGQTINYSSTDTGVKTITWKLANSPQNGTFVTSPTGMYSISYEDLAKTKQVWSWEVGSGGFSVSNGDDNAGTLIKTSHTSDAILMQDYRKSYGTAKLEYEDLVNIEPYIIPSSWFQSGWTQYNTSGSGVPYIYRKGRSVQLVGAVKPTVVKPGGTTLQHVMTLPPEFRPPRGMNIRQQGSAYNDFMLSVNLDGTVMVGRHKSNTADGIDFPVGAWLNICISYVTMD